MKKLVVLCGFIGSGKTTYAMKTYKHFTDLDYMPMHSRKADQIRLTLSLLEKHDEVCHITTFPTNEEVYAFRNLSPKYLFLDTSIERCKANIRIRGRVRDMVDLKRVFDANIDMQKKLQRSARAFEFIKVFRSPL